MSATEALIYLIYACAVVLPLVPGLLELRAASDDDALRIDASYARDPRFLGKSMRGKLLPILNETEGEARVAFLNRKNEFARVVDRLDEGPHSRIDDVVLSRGPFRVGEESALLDVYARGNAHIGASSRLRTLAVDGSAILGPSTHVVRWVDAEGECTVGAGCELGQSVTASKRLLLGASVRFNRLFGRPISVVDSRAAEVRALTDGVAIASYANDRLLAKYLVVDDGMTYDVDIVASGDVEIGPGACVTGSIKAGGTVTVREGARVLGNVVARGTVTIETDGTIFGHIFGDRDVVLRPGALMGDRHAPKTLHASRMAYLEPGSCVFGWVIAERGGRT